MNFLDMAAYSIEGFVKIWCPDTGEIFVNKRNAIHAENLSLSIEWLADIGKTIGFNRKELSYLCIENLRAVSSSTSVPEIYDLWSAQINGHIKKEETSKDEFP